MHVLRLLLGAMCLVIYSYTAIVIARHGLDFLSPFLVGLASLTWSGQFALDFGFYLLLSSIWIAWRHGFSASGWVLAAAAWFGAVYLLPYLFIISLRTKGSVEVLVLGVRSEARAWSAP